MNVSVDSSLWELAEAADERRAVRAQGPYSSSPIE